MSDIVERLREGCGCNFPETTCMAESECADAFEAADEIERLRAALSTARADALEDVARICDAELEKADPLNTCLYEAGYNLGCREIAAAIRALANPSSSEPSQ